MLKYEIKKKNINIKNLPKQKIKKTIKWMRIKSDMKKIKKDEIAKKKHSILKTILKNSNQRNGDEIWPLIKFKGNEIGKKIHKTFKIKKIVIKRTEIKCEGKINWRVDLKIKEEI